MRNWDSLRRAVKFGGEGVGGSQQACWKSGGGGEWKKRAFLVRPSEVVSVEVDAACAESIGRECRSAGGVNGVGGEVVYGVNGVG